MDFSGNNLEDGKIFVFVFGDEWEDIRIILSEQEAINISKKYPKNRVEIFNKNNNTETLNFGYSPSYNYYKNGKLNTNI